MKENKRDILKQKYNEYKEEKKKVIIKRNHIQERIIKKLDKDNEINKRN